MGLHESKNVVIPANEAYGSVDPSLIISVPISRFGNQTIRQGMTVTETASSGQQRQGLVTSVNATNATLDFNSPLAGKTLLFNITVVKISK